MELKMRLALMAIMAILLAAPPAGAVEKAELKNAKDKLSYVLGYSLGSNMKRDQVEVNQDLFLQALKEGLGGGKAILDDAEMRQVMQQFSQDLQTRRREVRRKLAEENEKAGKAFLEANKKNKGVKELKSGLQYKVLKPGKGKSPSPTDLVTVHYRGTKIDGSEFDSSYGRGQPAKFQLSRVIRGWQEALQKMKPGATWEIFVPANLAYGPMGQGPKVGPNETLVFKVELLKVEPSPPPKAKSGKGVTVTPGPSKLPDKGKDKDADKKKPGTN
jgi:FKBP-type peptidyl-prolyl cis-trans isomerase FklB